MHLFYSIQKILLASILTLAPILQTGCQYRMAHASTGVFPALSGTVHAGANQSANAQEGAKTAGSPAQDNVFSIFLGEGNGNGNANTEQGTVIDSVIYDTEGRTLVQIRRNGHLRITNQPQATQQPSNFGLNSKPTRKLESIFVMLDSGREINVVQNAQRHPFKSGDRIRFVNGKRMSVYHLNH